MNILSRNNMASCVKHNAIRCDHLDSASIHLDVGRSPYRNRNLLSVECKHSKPPSIFYSCTAHFSTKIVPLAVKQARKCPFY